MTIALVILDCLNPGFFIPIFYELVEDSGVFCPTNDSSVDLRSVGVVTYFAHMVSILIRLNWEGSGSTRLHEGLKIDARPTWMIRIDGPNYWYFIEEEISKNRPGQK